MGAGGYPIKEWLSDRGCGGQRFSTSKWRTHLCDATFHVRKLEHLPVVAPTGHRGHEKFF
jgi:hypothetical protein